jgi:hypothetical protein
MLVGWSPLRPVEVMSCSKTTALMSGRWAIESNEGAGGSQDRRRVLVDCDMVAVRARYGRQIVPFARCMRRIHYLSPSRAGNRQHQKRRKCK